MPRRFRRGSAHVARLKAGDNASFHRAVVWVVFRSGAIERLVGVLQCPHPVESEQFPVDVFPRGTRATSLKGSKQELSPRTATETMRFDYSMTRIVSESESALGRYRAFDKVNHDRVPLSLGRVGLDLSSLRTHSPTAVHESRSPTQVVRGVTLEAARSSHLAAF